MKHCAQGLCFETEGIKETNGNGYLFISFAKDRAVYPLSPTSQNSQ